MLYFLNGALHTEKQQIPIAVFSLTRSVLEPMIYRSLGEHAKHYNTVTDAVVLGLSLTLFGCTSSSRLSQKNTCLLFGLMTQQDCTPRLLNRFYSVAEPFFYSMGKKHQTYIRLIFFSHRLQILQADPTTYGRKKYISCLIEKHHQLLILFLYILYLMLQRKQIQGRS